MALFVPFLREHPCGIVECDTNRHGMTKNDDDVKFKPIKIIRYYFCGANVSSPKSQ